MKKGRVVVIKCRHVSANHRELSANQYRDTLRGRPDIRENLVRITHIMLKKRFYLTTQRRPVILTMSIRIEDS